MTQLSAKFIGTLAVAGTLIAVSAAADTSTTSVSKAAPSLLDKIVFSYWASYSGPSITNPSDKTNDGDNAGNMTALQNLDSTFTLGYKITPGLVLAGNYRFILKPTVAGGDDNGKNYFYRNKDPWINLIAPKLVHANGLNLWADIRFYLPAVSNEKEYGAIRMTQITTYDIPKTRLSLGVFSFERANLLTDVGASGAMENLDFQVSPFMSFQMTSTLAATLWSDVVQATYASYPSINATNAGMAPLGWDNQTVDVSVGVGWDITPSFNVNPQVTVYPGTATWDSLTIGAIVSAKFL